MDETTIVDVQLRLCCSLLRICTEVAETNGRDSINAAAFQHDGVGLSYTEAC
jgi:hypothetical protein